MQSEFYTRVFNQFNSSNLKLMFAYGSSVFQQLENKITKTGSIVDFVLIVDDSVKFHQDNLQKNSSHYSALKYLGPYYLAKIQNNYPAGCYYNTLVKFEDRLIKYGVISTQTLIKDLLDWEYYYLSGRLNKPVKFIKWNDNDKNLLNALNVNLKNAIHTSLLLLPEKFSIEELFIKITCLSYSGDFRMVIGENKNKIRNIVLPNMSHFIKLYKPILLQEAPYLYWNELTNQLDQELDFKTIYHHLNFLPKNLLYKMIHKSILKQTRQYYDLEEILFKLATRIDLHEIIQKSMKSIVFCSSLAQSTKSALTAGLFKSLDYSARKLKKMLIK